MMNLKLPFIRWMHGLIVLLLIAPSGSGMAGPPNPEPDQPNIKAETGLDVFLPVLVRGAPERTITTQISAGGSHNCLQEANGSLTCWGGNLHGQSDPPAESFSQISTGAGNTCGLRLDGSVACWGWNCQWTVQSPGGQLYPGQPGGTAYLWLKSGWQCGVLGG